MYQILKHRTQGQDYFVGDIHGRYDARIAELSEVGFDINRDRLISVDDLVDRGEPRALVRELLNNAWFYAVRGNHEQFILDQYDSDRIMLGGIYSDYFACEIHQKWPVMRQVCFIPSMNQIVRELHSN